MNRLEESRRESGWDVKLIIWTSWRSWISGSSLTDLFVGLAMRLGGIMSSDPWVEDLGKYIHERASAFNFLDPGQN